MPFDCTSVVGPFDELTWAPAWRIRELVEGKEVSPTEVAEHFLGRIEEFQSELGAFTNVDPALVRAQAEAAEDAVLSREDLGPLHGVPVAVKSHIDIAGMPRPGMPFRFGTAQRDDLAVERLRAAGAVILGHNPMPRITPEGAYDWDVLPRNPWDPERVPGISSAGGAVAVAAGLAPVVLGSDGGGSSRLPSAYSGVFGMNPTAGPAPLGGPPVLCRSPRHHRRPALQGCPRRRRRPVRHRWPGRPGPPWTAR